MIGVLRGLALRRRALVLRSAAQRERLARAAAPWGSRIRVAEQLWKWVLGGLALASLVRRLR